MGRERKGGREGEGTVEKKEEGREAEEKKKDPERERFLHSPLTV